MSVDVTSGGPRLLIYNPQLWERDVLMSAQTGRDNVIEALLDAVKQSMAGHPPRHQLLLGEPGAGKTMLACCACYAINEDAQLAQQCLAVRLPEQQLNVATLSDLYANAADALATQLSKRAASAALAARISGALTQLPEFEGQRTVALWRMLEDAAESLRRRLVFVIDNVDKTVARLGARQRKQLLTRLNDPTAPLWIGTAAGIGATAKPANPALNKLLQEAPFETHQLRPLAAAAARAMLLSLAERHRADGVRRLVQQKPQRIDTLTALAGRQPRSLALLYEALTSHSEMPGQFQLEGYLDRRTPHFEARIEALPAQAQQVFDALARRLSPARAAEVGDALRMETNAVSSQLHRLVKAGLVEKVPYDPPRRAGFQVAERTMNLWYLMRAGGAYRRKLAMVVAYRGMAQQPLEVADNPPPRFDIDARSEVRQATVDPNEALQPLQLSTRERTLLRAGAADLEQSKWPAAPMWVQQFVHACEVRHNDKRFQTVVQVLRQAVVQGATNDVLVLLDALVQDTPAGDRWLPLVVPVHALRLGHKLPLRRLAPELRDLAEAVLHAIHDGAPLPEQPRSHTRYGSG